MITGMSMFDLALLKSSDAFSNISFRNGTDTFETYRTSFTLAGNSQGTGAWNGEWVSRVAQTVGLSGTETFDTVSAGTSVNGLTSGRGFPAPWVSAGGFVGLNAYDDFSELISAGISLSGKNTGYGFASTWVTR